MSSLNRTSTPPAPSPLQDAEDGEPFNIEDLAPAAVLAPMSEDAWAASVSRLATESACLGRGRNLSAIVAATLATPLQQHIRAVTAQVAPPALPLNEIETLAHGETALRLARGIQTDDLLNINAKLFVAQIAQGLGRIANEAEAERKYVRMMGNIGFLDAYARVVAETVPLPVLTDVNERLSTSPCLRQVFDTVGFMYEWSANTRVGLRRKFAELYSPAGGSTLNGVNAAEKESRLKSCNDLASRLHGTSRHMGRKQVQQMGREMAKIFTPADIVLLNDFCGSEGGSKWNALQRSIQDKAVPLTQTEAYTQAVMKLTLEVTGIGPIVDEMERLGLARDP